MLLLALIALCLTTTCAKHHGDEITIEAPPISNKSNQSAGSIQRNQSKTALSTEFTVFTLPLRERVSLSTLGRQSLAQVFNSCAAYDEYAREVYASQAVYKQLGYLKLSPEMELKYFLSKTTFADAETACAADGAALYTFDHSTQLDAVMAEYYPLLKPWVDVRKPGADYASTLCGFLTAPAPGKSSIQWDDCTTLHNFICEKKTSPSKPLGAQTAFARSRIGTVSARQTASQTAYLAQYVNAIYDEVTIYIPLIDPILSAATSYTSFLTPDEVTQLQAYPTTKDSYFRETVIANATLNANEILTSAQIQQIHSSLALGESLFAITGSIINKLATPFSLTPEQVSTSAGIKTEGVNLLVVMQEPFNDPNVQPNPTAQQITRMQDAYLALKSLVELAVTYYSSFSTPTTTPSTTTTQAPELPVILRLLKDFLNQFLPVTGYLRRLFTLVTTQPELLTSAEIAQIQDFIKNIDFPLLPNVLPYLYPATQYQVRVVQLPVLSTAQMQQAQAAIDQSINIYNNAIGLISSLAPKFPDLFSPVMQQISAVIAAEGFGIMSIMEDAFSNVNVQPTLTSLQETVVQQYLYKAQAFLAGIPTGPLPPPTTTPPLPPLAKYLQDYLTQTLIYTSFLELVMAKAATHPELLTSAQTAQVQDYYVKCQNFGLTDVITMLATTPTLTPAQMQQAKAAIDQVYSMTTTAANLFDPLSTIFQYNATTKRAAIAGVSQPPKFYTIMQAIFSNPNVQPTITPAQEAQLQAIIAPNQRLVSSIVTAINVATSPSPSPLVQYLFTILTQAQTSYSLLLPVLNTSSTLNLTPKERTQLQAILTEADNFLYNLLPSVVSAVTRNGTLTPAQLASVRSSIAQGINLFTSIQCLLEKLERRLHLSSTQRRAIENLTDVSVNMFGNLLSIVLAQNGTPTFSATQLQQLANVTAYSETIFDSYSSAFATSTTVTVPTSTTPTTTRRPRPTRPWTKPRPTTPSSHGGNDHLVVSRIEKRLIVARIAGLIAELEALVTMWKLQGTGEL